jgi:DHA1 family tetracycline resistance protein-like MFS transporter
MLNEETNPILESPDNYGSLQRSFKRKSYFSICFLYILYSLSFTLTIPAVPALTLHLTNNDAIHSSYVFGIASFLRYILEFFASPLIGTIADAKGRKVVFLTAFFVSGLEYILLGLFPSIPMLFLTRVLSGLGDGGVSAGYAMITDIAIYNDDLVSQQYGVLGSMFGLAFIIGPFVGGLLCEIHVVWCFVVAFLISMIGAGCTYFYLEETKHYKEDVRKRAASSTHTIIIEEPRHDSITSLDPLIGLKTHLSNSRICYLVIILACCTLTTGLHFIWYIYMSYVYHATPTEVGMYLSFHGILSAIAQGVLLQVFIPDMISESYAAFFALF